VTPISFRRLVYDGAIRWSKIFEDKLRKDKKNEDKLKRYNTASRQTIGRTDIRSTERDWPTSERKNR